MLSALIAEVAAEMMALGDDMNDIMKLSNSAFLMTARKHAVGKQNDIRSRPSGVRR